MTTIRAVIGANYGDEGKGRMVDYFVSKANPKSCVVVCTNGGSQRGHTVVTPTHQQHIFSHFGSGSFLGADTYLPKHFIVNPMQFYKEFMKLFDLGVKPRVYINQDCLCSTPFDMIANQIIEENRINKHGSCGMGIWETILRNGLTVKEMSLMTTEELRKYLSNIRDIYTSNRLKNKKCNINKFWRQVLPSWQLIENYIKDFKFMVDMTYITDDNFLRDKETIIFENGQGLLLDQNIFDSKYSTPSNTGSKNIREILDNVFDDYDIEVCYVTRTYLTRHGEGVLLEEDKWHEIIQHPAFNLETNHYNQYQGYLRYGHLNIDDLNKRVVKDFNTYWDNNNNNNTLSYAVTHIDEQPMDISKLNFSGKVYKSFGVTRHDAIALGKDFNKTNEHLFHI